MLYLTCTMISSVDLAHFGLSRAKDWLSVDCGTISNTINGDYCIVIFRFKNILLIYMYSLVSLVMHKDSCICTYMHQWKQKERTAIR